jgi:triacylglycerol lipase
VNTLVWIVVAVIALVLLAALVFVVVVAAAYAARAAYLGASRPALSVPQGAALVLREAIAQARIVGWNLTRTGAGDILGAVPGDPSDDNVVPIVLAHGLAADGTSMWMLRRAFANGGRPTYAPHLGRMFRPLARYAAALERTIDQALLEHPRAEGFDVIAHSMGGIVLRHCLRVRPDLARKVRRVVTIASPHAGTRLATHIPMVEARALFPDAAWLLELPTLRRLLPTAPITTIASRHDAVVYPHETCMVEGAAHHELDRVGHAELLMDARVVHLVKSALA